MKSDPSSAGEASDLLVEKECSRPFDLIWCDQSGAEVVYEAMKPGGSYQQLSYLDHVRAFRDAEDGQLLGCTALSASEKICITADGNTASKCGTGASNTQVTCCSCKEAHDRVKGGEQVLSYLHPLTETSHVLMMADGRWVCEFCYARICSACGKTAWDAQPCVGNWSGSGYRCSDCAAMNKTGEWRWKRDVLYKMGDDMNRAHCSTCQRQLLQRTLVDRAPPRKKQSAGNMLDQAEGLALTAAAAEAAAEAVGCTIM